MGHAQRQAAKERNWVFHAGAWLLWNTVHGDRYAAFGPPPIALPLRDRDFSHTRSLARNSLSPAIGGMVERRIYKSLWMAAGLEFVGRPQKYVFDPDTLAAYPPIAPPPFGLYFKQVIHYWYGLELPVMVEMKTAIGSSALEFLFTRTYIVRVLPYALMAQAMSCTIPLRGTVHC